MSYLPDAHGPSRTDYDPSLPDLITGGNILERITPHTEQYNARIVEYVPYVNEQSGGLELLSAEITVSGKYIPLVRILDILESHVRECEVKSVEFERIYNAKDRQTALKAVITVQQLITRQP
ncbi:MAG: hypothetical protein LUD76_05280 [Alistipes sp.]|nr:hypothetical protein [Alistipes sp.]